MKRKLEIDKVSMKEALRPTSAEEVYEKSMVNKTEDRVTETCTLEEYDNIRVSKLKDKYPVDKYGETLKRILDLEDENEFLKGEIGSLKEKISECESRNSMAESALEKESEYTETISRMENENDEFVLKMADLEFQIAQLRVERDRLAVEVQRFKDSEKHVYTKPTYDTRITVKGGGYFPSMNGYQEWR